MALASKKRGNKAPAKTPMKTQAALKKAETASETPDETTVKEAATKFQAETKAAKTTEASPIPVPEKSKQVTIKTQTLPASHEKMVLALDCCKNATEPYDFGALPRITSEQGALLCDKENLGNQIEITVLSYNDAFTVAPNDKDAPGELCRYSYDGVTLNDGSGISVDEHVAELRGLGYKKAGATHRYEIIALLDDAVEDHDEIGSVVQLSLSNQSAKQFDRYKLNSAVRIRKGELTEEDAAKVTVTAKTKTFAFTFTMMRFSSTVLEG